MTRTMVTLRCAVLADAEFLVDVWSDSLRRAERHEQVADLELVIKTAEESPEQRLLIADYDGEPAGAVHLRVTTATAINLEPTMQALAPCVLSAYRRRGVGRYLMEAAVAFAEELGIAYVTTSATSGSRDGNRFMARLGLGPQAVLRAASTHVVRSKIEAQRPVVQRTSGRQLGQVLAARRSMRRAGHNAVPAEES